MAVTTTDILPSSPKSALFNIRSPENSILLVAVIPLSSNLFIILSGFGILMSRGR